MLKLLLSIGIMLSLAQIKFLPGALAEEATYYVAVTGLDTNPGTVNKPFRTIQYAVNHLNAGDTLLVRAGVYQETINIRQSGTVNQPITIAAYPGEQVVIDGAYQLPAVPAAGWARCNQTLSPPTCFHWGALVRISGSFITLDGFEITRSLGRGIVVSPVNRVRPTTIIIRNNRIHDNRNAGALFLAADQVLFEANDVWHSGDYATHDRAAAELNWPVAVSGRDTTHVRYERNRIFNNWTEGLDTGVDSVNVWVQDNEIFDNYALQLYVNRSQQVMIQRNLVYCTNDAAFYRNGKVSPGIVLNNENSNAHSIAVNDVQVRNNIVAGCGQNFAVWGGQGRQKKGVSHVLIANNLLLNGIANQKEAPVSEFYLVTAPHEQIVVKDNLILQAGQDSIIVPKSPEIVFAHNWWLHRPPDHVASASDMIGDPGLFNPYGRLVPGQVDAHSFQFSVAAAASVGPIASIADQRGPQRAFNSCHCTANTGTSD